MSSEQSESEQPSEKVPLVPLAVKFDSLAKLLFHRSLTFENGGNGGNNGPSGTGPSSHGGSGSSMTTAAGLSGSRDSDLSSSR